MNTDKCCDGFIADFDQFSAKKMPNFWATNVTMDFYTK
jgi:hypothetical protein